MREIEFRVWLKYKKEMVGVTTIDFKKGCVFIDKPYFPKIPEYYGTALLFDQIELMQYTGIRDKNGVKIFEGDIVKTYSDYVYVVYFDERSGAFGLITGSPYEDRKWFDDISNMVVINNLEVYKNLEVIGNIYENPELLGEKDE